jgi:hypothetical protein
MDKLNTRVIIPKLLKYLKNPEPNHPPLSNVSGSSEIFLSGVRTSKKLEICFIS